MAVAVFLALQRLTPVWDRMAERQMGELSIRFRKLGLDEERMLLLLRLWGVTLVCGTAFIWIWLGKPPLACVFAFLVYVAPRHILDFLVRYRTRLIRDQLVGVTVGVGNAVGAGLSLAQAIKSVSEIAPRPLVTELRRISFQFDRGRPLQEAIEEVRQRLDLESFTLFAVALAVAHKRGGRINDTLQRISTTLQERQRLERKIEAETSAGRQTVLILSICPALFLVMFSWMNPESTSLLWTRLDGQCVLVVVAILVYIGVRWASRIMNVEF